MKSKILNKASDLFLQFGFKSVTMDDIARELGMSKKTIYSHYATKLKLVEECVFYMFDKINNGMCSVCSGLNNPIQEILQIDSFVRQQLKGMKTSPEYQLQKYYPRIFKSLSVKKFETVRDFINDNLSRGVKQGLYRADLDIVMISRFYINGIMGLSNPSLYPPEKYDIHQMKSAFLEYHLRAIVTEKGLKTLLKIINK